MTNDHVLTDSILAGHHHPRCRWFEGGWFVSRVVRPSSPFILPWSDGRGGTLGPVDWVKSRPFTTFHLIISMSLLAWLGFGSTTSCETEAQRLICANAIWPSDLVEAPHRLFLSYITAPWFHNSMEHILLIVVCLFLISQTAEVRLGTKRTVFLFFTGTAVVATIIAIILNVGASLHDSPWFSGGLARNWMGGSVGLYCAMGALFAQTRRPEFAFLAYFVFDALNLFVYHGAASQTISAHVLAVALGGAIGWRWRNEGMEWDPVANYTSSPI